MPHLYYCFDPPDSRSPSQVSSREHLLGRRLLAHGLSEQYGLPFSEDELSFGPHGKPYLFSHPEIHFSITHCRGLVAGALDDQPIGADAEGPRKRILPSLKKRVLSSEEQVFLASVSDDESVERFWFLRFWTLKEAYVKLTGAGIAANLQAIGFSFDDKERPACSDPAITCFQTVLNGGYVLSLCFQGQDDAVELHEIPLEQLE